MSQWYGWFLTNNWIFLDCPDLYHRLKAMYSLEYCNVPLTFPWPSELWDSFHFLRQVLYIPAGFRMCARIVAGNACNFKAFAHTLKTRGWCMAPSLPVTERLLFQAPWSAKWFCHWVPLSRFCWLFFTNGRCSRSSISPLQWADVNFETGSNS